MKSIKYIKSFKTLFFTIITINLANIAFALGSITTLMGLKKILIKRFKTKHIVAGYNFRFGYKRKGNVQLLNKLSKKYDYYLIIIIVWSR